MKMMIIVVMMKAMDNDYEGDDYGDDEVDDDLIQSEARSRESREAWDQRLSLFSLLNAFSHLYKKVCLSVCLSERQPFWRKEGVGESIEYERMPSTDWYRHQYRYEYKYQ